MSRITGTETLSLMEAYQAVYSPQQSLEEEIFESVAYALISQGYTATDVLEYFANTDDEVIIEDIVALSEGTLIIESVVSEEYIEEQYEILNEALPLAAGLALGAKALVGAGARRTAGAVIKRMAGPGVRKAIGGAVGKLKGLAGGAKAALSKLPKPVKTLGKLAIGGAAFEAGAGAVRKMTGGGSKPAPKPSDLGPQKALGGQASFKAGGGQAAVAKGKSATDVQRAGSEALFKAGGGAAAIAKKGQTRAQVMAQGSKNVAPKPTAAPTASSAAPSGSGGGGSSTTPSTPAKPKLSPTKPSDSDTKLTKMQQWAKANPGLASKVKPGQSGYDDISATRTKPGPNEKQDQTPTQGPPDAKIDTKAVDAALKAQQEKDKNKAKPQAVNSSYEYDAFDLVLEYLTSEGHVDTLDEALYVMMEMDVKTIGSIVENRGMSYSGGKPGASGDGGKPTGITGGTTYKMKGWDDDKDPKKSKVKGV
jgi:hypothetical protein